MSRFCKDVFSCVRQRFAAIERGNPIFDLSRPSGLDIRNRRMQRFKQSLRQLGTFLSSQSPSFLFDFFKGSSQIPTSESVR